MAADRRPGPGAAGPRPPTAPAVVAGATGRGFVLVRRRSDDDDTATEDDIRQLLPAPGHAGRTTPGTAGARPAPRAEGGGRRAVEGDPRRPGAGPDWCGYARPTTPASSPFRPGSAAARERGRLRPLARARIRDVLSNPRHADPARPRRRAPRRSRPLEQAIVDDLAVRPWARPTPAGLIEARRRPRGFAHRDGGPRSTPAARVGTSTDDPAVRRPRRRQGVSARLGGCRLDRRRGAGGGAAEPGGADGWACAARAPASGAAGPDGGPWRGNGAERRECGR